ncbi:hypothetical protein BLOT_003589 [Blomia tropicalis]|nr:hypothetical protein BLOT_003589 [Blomia tropicalis]
MFSSQVDLTSPQTPSFTCHVTLSLNLQMIMGNRTIVLPIDNYSNEALSLTIEIILLYSSTYGIVASGRSIKFEF